MSVHAGSTASTPHRTLLRWSRWPVAMLCGAITAYQRFISPLLGPRCKYYPSCSAYAQQSLRLNGVFKGVTLALWRILRCNPFSDGGYDPVKSAGKSAENR